MVNTNVFNCLSVSLGNVLRIWSYKAWSMKTAVSIRAEDLSLVDRRCRVRLSLSESSSKNVTFGSGAGTSIKKSFSVSLLTDQ